MNKFGKALASANLNLVSSHFDKDEKLGLKVDGKVVWYRVTKHQTFKNEDNTRWTAGYITQRDLDLLKKYDNVYSYVVNTVTKRRFLIDIKSAEKYISAGKVPSHRKFDIMYCVQDLPKSTYIEL